MDIPLINNDGPPMANGETTRFEPIRWKTPSYCVADFVVVPIRDNPASSRYSRSFIYPINGIASSFGHILSIHYLPLSGMLTPRLPTESGKSRGLMDRYKAGMTKMVGAQQIGLNSGGLSKESVDLERLLQSSGLRFEMHSAGTSVGELILGIPGSNCVAVSFHAEELIIRRRLGDEEII